MTMRLPASGEAGVDEAEGSATLAAHFFKNVLGTGVDEEPGHAFSEGASLIGWSGVALLDVLEAVDGADAGVEDELVALHAGPSAEWYLAAALENGEERAFGDDGGAGFGVVEFFERSERFIV